MLSVDRFSSAKNAGPKEPKYVLTMASYTCEHHNGTVLSFLKTDISSITPSALQEMYVTKIQWLRQNLRTYKQNSTFDFELYWQAFPFPTVPKYKGIMGWCMAIYIKIKINILN